MDGPYRLPWRTVYRLPWSGAAQLQAAGKSSCCCWCSSTECSQNTVKSFITQGRQGSKIWLDPCRLSGHDKEYRTGMSSTVGCAICALHISLYGWEPINRKKASSSTIVPSQSFFPNSRSVLPDRFGLCQKSSIIATGERYRTIPTLLLWIFIVSLPWISIRNI